MTATIIDRCDSYLLGCYILFLVTGYDRLCPLSQNGTLHQMEKGTNKAFPCPPVVSVRVLTCRTCLPTQATSVSYCILSRKHESSHQCPTLSQALLPLLSSPDVARCAPGEVIIQPATRGRQPPMLWKLGSERS